MDTHIEIGNRLQAKRQELADVWASYPNLSTEQVEKGRQLNAELPDISKKYDEALSVFNANEANRKALQDWQTPVNPMVHSNGKGKTAAEVKTLTDYLAESKSYEGYRGRANTGAKGFTIAIPSLADFKTLLTLTNINVPPTHRAGIIPSAQNERTVADLMLQGTISGNTYTYYEETTFTNNAAEVEEGGTKPESALDFTERTEPVRKIATNIPVTTETLDDVPAFESYLRGRLAFMVERREETQLLTGDGTAPNISGILDRSIQTQAKGADPTPDAVYKAMTKVRHTGEAEPTAAVFHPNDWQDIRLLRTADGMYIWGPPMDMGPERIFGLEVRITSAMTENTGLVGAFRPHAQIFRRQGITITVSTEHSTFFIENKVMVQAEERLLLAVYRPAAFCKITGI